ELVRHLRELLLLLLGGLDFVARHPPLVMLPAVKEEAEEEGSEQARHTDVLAPVSTIRLANDVQVVDAFFKMNFNGHQLLSQARSFALRALGLRRRSSSEAITTFFVSTFPGTTGVRNLFLTIRSSREWNVTTTRRPPGRTSRMAPSRKDSRLLSSSL